MLGIVSSCVIVTLSLRRAVIPIFDFKNTVTLKTRLGVRQGHWIERIRYPIDSNYGSISYRFWDIQCRKMSWPWNLGQRSLKVIESGTLWLILYGFLLVFFSNFVRKTHRFWGIRLVSIQWPRNPGLRSLKVIVNDTVRSGTHDFILTFHSNHGPISHRFRDKRRFASKIDNFFHPRVFCAPAEGVVLGIGYGAGVRKN